MAAELELPAGVCPACLQDAINAYRFKMLYLDSCRSWDTGATTLAMVDFDDPSDTDKTYYIFYKDGVDTIIKDQVSEVYNAGSALGILTTDLRNKREKLYKPCLCPYCHMPFNKLYGLHQHLKSTTVRACTECGLVMPRENLAEHLGEVHNRRVYHCSECFKLFDDLANAKEHRKLHAASEFGCKTCGFISVNARGLQAHMYKHSLFHCGSCTTSFENRKCFKYHKKTCSFNTKRFKPNLFICDYCGAKYDKKPSLKIHIIQKHMNVLPFGCQTCGKRTSTLAHLRSHEKVHSTDRTLYKCECGSKMRTYLGYQLHQRIHSGEKPYQCDECGERFLSNSRRLDHIKRRHRHAKDLAHGCNKCKARFVRPFELRKHYAVCEFRDKRGSVF